MKILMVNKFYHIVGGSETYYFALKRLLESKGHEVIDFSMKDDSNFSSPYENYFVENVDYKNLHGIVKKIKAGANIIYSKEAKTKFEQLVIETKPDLIHLHLFQHQISPSILSVIKKYGIPTVYTAHELKMICPNYRMFQNGKICERCKGGKYYNCALNKCLKGSFAMSIIAMIEGYYHKIHKSYDSIDVIITPSNFYKNKFEEFGVTSNRVIHIPNFLDAEKPKISKTSDSESYYLYFGRLSNEKGLMTLLEAFRSCGNNLYIAGTGEMEPYIVEYIKTHDMNNAKLLGFKSGDDLKDLVGNSKAVILTSEWYENGPYSAIESLQLGRPIIGTKIGGIPELVKNNGYLFKKGDAKELAACIQKMENASDDEYEAMKKASLKLFEEEYTSENHYKKLEIAYKKALEKKGKFINESNSVLSSAVS